MIFRRFTINILKHKFIPLSKTTLYIHIPFCTKKCSYCDFYSKKLSSNIEIKTVLDRILDDIELMLKKIGSPKIKTLFIGGGTPSSIPILLLEDFLGRLNGIIEDLSIESTIELNPETVTIDLLRVLFNNRINRISLGVQSLDDMVLNTLGRNTTREKTLYALDIIKKHWPGLFSIDLINAVPGQTIEKALSDISKINFFSPDHVSLYSLTFEPGTELYRLLAKGQIISILENTDNLMQKESISLLKSFGFNRYEISNYSKNGMESLHNLNYWKMGSYLGAGPAAASTLLDNSGPVRIIFKPDTSLFISSAPFSVRTEFESISKESFLLEHLMMGFRLLEGIDIKHINYVFNIDIKVFLTPLFKKWDKILLFNKESIFLTENGLFLLNPFLIDVASLIDEQCFGIVDKEINWPILTAQF